MKVSTEILFFSVMATAEERKLELERKKQKLAEIREEKRRREEERRRNLLRSTAIENGAGIPWKHFLSFFPTNRLSLCRAQKTICFFYMYSFFSGRHTENFFAERFERNFGAAGNIIAASH